MCEKPLEVWVCSVPKPMFGNWRLITRQYNEVVRGDKYYVLFKSKKNYNLSKKFREVITCYLPCGKCVQCLSTRSNNWTLRNSLELMSNYSIDPYHRGINNACCLTLTYDDEHLPADGLLQYKDVQKFIKRLRITLKRQGISDKIKYCCCGEYGSHTYRPHYHIIIYGFFPLDINLFKPFYISKRGTKIYKSDFITNLWQNGIVDVGCVNHQCCRYISQYITKKAVCKSPEYDEKISKQREFLHCSTGFGLDWFKKNYRSVIEAGKIILGKFTYSIPRYFVKKLQSLNKTLYTNYIKKCQEYFLNYKLDETEIKNIRARSDLILSKLKLFRPDFYPKKIFA